MNINAPFVKQIYFLLVAAHFPVSILQIAVLFHLEVYVSNAVLKAFPIKGHSHLTPKAAIVRRATPQNDGVSGDLADLGVF